MSEAKRAFAAARASAIGSRDGNQDRCLFLDDGNTVLLGVADGLGGHPRGDVAAQLLNDVSESLFRQAPRPLGDPQRFMLTCIARAHEAIRRFGGRQAPPIAPRTTAVLAVIQHGIAHWAHVGDSRLYLFRAGELVAQTTDHAQTQYVRYSATAPPRVRTSLTRCIGGLPQPPTTTCGPPLILQAGDALLLCTDGLWGQAPHERMTALFDGPPDELETRLTALVNAAADHPLSDNVTAVALTWLAPAADYDPATQVRHTAPYDAEPEFDSDPSRDED